MLFFAGCFLLFKERTGYPERQPVQGFQAGGTGRLPGKPEQNAVPRKGDNMALVRAGKGFQLSAYYIFIVHTAAPFKGATDFFIRHISALFPDKLQKNTVFLLQAHLPFCGCAFFSFSAAYIFRSGAVRLPSSPENFFSKFQDWRKTE